MNARAGRASTPCIVRPANPDDLGELVTLCAEHALYEGAAFTPEGKAERLTRALFNDPARLHAWVAESEGALVGYATATPEFSTWNACEFLHMDCLFVRDGWRGAGVGAALLDAVVEHARRAGLMDIQWQTPDWNTDAARFYRRTGAVGQAKLRFVLCTKFTADGAGGG